MEKQTYIRTETRNGYIFDGTLECAKEIYQEIKTHSPTALSAFELEYNLKEDKFQFEWGGYEIQKGDFIAIREEHNKHLFEHPIDIIRQKDLTRWGYKTQE
jgi:DNA-binding winged helix-turn-helix (wHTH) protein